MIKNWTVKTKQIKKKESGLINHVNYLLDQDRGAHRHTQIIDLTNATRSAGRILAEVEKRQEKRKEEGLRGGSIANYATSFVCAIPRDIPQPKNREEWGRITASMIKSLGESVGIDPEVIAKTAVAVVHDETASESKSSHIHLLISNIHDGQAVKKITQYGATHAVKNGFNRGVKKVLGVSNLDYTPKNTKVKDKPLYVARQEKAEKELSQHKIWREKVKKELDHFKRFKEVFANWLGKIRRKVSDEVDAEIVRDAKALAEITASLEEQKSPEAETVLENIKEEEEQAERLAPEEKPTEHLNEARSKRKRRRRKR